MQTIKVILWDIDGTLLDFDAAETEAINACFRIFDLGTCTDEMLRTYKEINRTYWKRLERGELTKPEVLEGRFRDFFAAYHIDTSVAPKFNAEYQVRLGDTVCFHPNGLEMVKSLKGKVLQCAVTNGTKVAQDRKLRNSGLDELLDGIFISDVIGIEKPSVGFFDEVFRSIGEYEPSEVLIIGDSLTSDIQGGNNAGILTCWFNPERKEHNTNLRIDYEIQDLGEVNEIVMGL